MNTTAGLKVVSERLSAVWRAALRSGEENKRAFSFILGRVCLKGNRDWSLRGEEIAETRFCARICDSRAVYDSYMGVCVCMYGCVCVCTCVSGWINGWMFNSSRYPRRNACSERKGSINSTTFMNHGRGGGRGSSGVAKKRITRTSVTHESENQRKTERINNDGT